MPQSILRSWPPPVKLRPIFRRARALYRRLALTERPALDMPTAAMVLFSKDDLTALTIAGYFPLSRRAKVWLKDEPRRQRPRYVKRLLAEITELAAAVADLEARGTGK